MNAINAIKSVATGAANAIGAASTAAMKTLKAAAKQGQNEEADSSADVGKSVSGSANFGAHNLKQASQQSAGVNSQVAAVVPNSNSATNAQAQIARAEEMKKAMASIGEFGSAFEKISKGWKDAGAKDDMKDAFDGIGGGGGGALV